jgi:hypothetical protein
VPSQTNPKLCLQSPIPINPNRALQYSQTQSHHNPFHTSSCKTAAQKEKLKMKNKEKLLQPVISRNPVLSNRGCPQTGINDAVELPATPFEPISSPPSSLHYPALLPSIKVALSPTPLLHRPRFHREAQSAVPPCRVAGSAEERKEKSWHR